LKLQAFVLHDEFMFKFVFLFSVPLFLNAVTTKSSVSLATGGAGVASVEPGEAVYSNPASILHLKGRYFFSTLQKDLVAVSFLENDRKSALPGAISYAGQKNLETFGISLADYVFRRISVGATLNYLQTKPERNEEKRTQHFNGSLGMTYVASPQFGIAAAFENITEISKELKEPGLLAPRTRLGMNYVYMDWFRFRFDVSTTDGNNFSELIPQAGFETFFGRWLIGRAGWSKVPGFDDSWSAGLGLSLPKFKLDYASQWLNQEKSEIRHSIDLGVPF